MFKNRNDLNNEKLDQVIDKIREKYGETAIIRGVFADTGLSPLLGGYSEDDYPAMNSIL